MDGCAQQVRPTICVSWLNSVADLERTPSWGINKYFDLSPMAYNLSPSLVISVLVLWLATVTNRVFIRSLFSHFCELHFAGIIVVTNVAVFEANLIRLSTSELNNPKVSSDTISLMSLM